ncbi:MAG: SPFH domain-containing protein [Patescibacteria group bacterium]
MIVIFVGIFIFLTGAFFLQGLRRIPADPPSRAVVTRFGRRTGYVKNEGWRFFPIYPWWGGYILVDMTKKNQDLTPREVRTAQDMAEIEVTVSLTWRPDCDFNPITSQSYLIEYLNSGGESGIKDILEDIVEEAVREFAADPNREPNTWEDAVKMKREFLAEIVAAILGRVPTQTPIDELNTIVIQLRRGNGTLKLETLGIVLNRVNVTSIRPKGKLAEAAEKQAIEKRERLAEVIELNHVGERINALKQLGFSNEQALEIIQTERGKVKKEISESKWNVSQETRAMIEKIGPEIVAKILGRGRE